MTIETNNLIILAEHILSPFNEEELSNILSVYGTIEGAYVILISIADYTKENINTTQVYKCDILKEPKEIQPAMTLDQIIMKPDNKSINPYTLKNFFDNVLSNYGDKYINKLIDFYEFFRMPDNISRKNLPFLISNSEDGFKDTLMKTTTILAPYYYSSVLNLEGLSLFSKPTKNSPSWIIPFSFNDKYMVKEGKYIYELGDNLFAIKIQNESAAEELYQLKDTKLYASSLYNSKNQIGKIEAISKNYIVARIFCTGDQKEFDEFCSKILYGKDLEYLFVGVGLHIVSNNSGIRYAYIGAPVRTTSQERRYHLTEIRHEIYEAAKAISKLTDTLEKLINEVEKEISEIDGEDEK